MSLGPAYPHASIAADGPTCEQCWVSLKWTDVVSCHRSGSLLRLPKLMPEATKSAYPLMTQII